MTDYRKLSPQEQAEVDRQIHLEVPYGNYMNPHNGHTWTEPENTLTNVHSGYYCAECWCSYYTCLCSHDS